jgi:hypothetical protein
MEIAHVLTTQALYISETVLTNLAAQRLPFPGKERPFDVVNTCGVTRAGKNGDQLCFARKSTPLHNLSNTSFIAFRA